jgi:tripartite-type tricarboxylate transporter receptor subunit TctC
MDVRRRVRAGALFLLLPLSIACLGGAALAQTPASFAGKTVTVAIGSGTGGSHDQYGHLVARHISQYLPGQPSVIAKNYPGAGGMTLANLMWSQVPRDGTTFGIIGRTIFLEPLINGKSAKGRFDPRQFSWIGSTDSITGVAIAWHTSPVKTYTDLLDHELIVGAAGAASGTATDAYVLRNLFGFKFRVIIGYPSGGDVDLAMERGEIEGRANVAWPGLKSRGLDEVKSGKIRLLYQLGLSRHPDLPDVPLVLDFARNDRERRILTLNFGINEIGYGFVAPPGVPAAPLAALRAAFKQTTDDPKFRAEAAKQRLDVHYVFPERIAAIFEQLYASPPDLIADWLRVSQPTVPDETARATTVSASSFAILAGGKRIGFEAGGMHQEARVDRRETAITIKGAKADVGALHQGLACEITYFGDKGTASRMACQ